MHIQDDHYYIKRIIDGDSSAFALLADRYKDMVFTLAIKMLNNREDAEEAAQDSFVKVYKSLHSFKGDSEFSTWLYRVTYNTCLDRLKKNKKERNIISIDDYTEDHLITLSNSLGSLEEKERRQLVQDCLHVLPGEDSFLLTLYYFEEQSLKEIAKILGINANHVKIRLYRSRKKMAAVFDRRIKTEKILFYENEHR